jgi:hypothetical protein
MTIAEFLTPHQAAPAGAAFYCCKAEEKTSHERKEELQEKRHPVSPFFARLRLCGKLFLPVRLNNIHDPQISCADHRYPSRRLRNRCSDPAPAAAGEAGGPETPY